VSRNIFTPLFEQDSEIMSVYENMQEKFEVLSLNRFGAVDI